MKSKFMQNDKVTWVCKRTNEALTGVVLKINDNSAIVEVLSIPFHKLGEYGLVNERTVVNFKRLSIFSLVND